MLDRLRSIFRRKSLSNPEPWLRELFSGGAISISGQTVSPTTAMRVPAVWCAVQAIADTVANLSVKLFRDLPEGGKEVDDQHPAHALVHDWASDWCSAESLRRQVMVDTITGGNGYVFANKVDSRPLELLRVSPHAVRVQVDDLTGEPSYVITGKNGGQRTYSYDTMIHISGPSLDGVSGIGAVQAGRETIALAAIIAEHVSRLFSAGAKPGGLLTTEKTLTPQAIENVRKIVEAQNAGVQNAGKTLVVPDGLKYAPLALNSTDAQLLELWRLQIEEIARVFRIPPNMIQDFGRATWSNWEGMGRAWLQSLLPWLRQWEAGYSRVLLTPEERRTHTIEFNVDSLLQADFAQRTAGYSTMIASRVYSPNEVRAKENLPPYEGGNEFLNPNTTPAAPGAEPKKESADV
jgi:HK97 family phage portal protein